MRRPRRVLAALAALASLIAGAGSGCTGSCRKTTPYVPFLEDAGTVAPRDGDVAATDTGVDGGQKSAFQKIQAALAPAGAAKWSVDGLAFDAPGGSGIVAALARDVDGDGQRDVIAWTQPLAGGGGELRFHRGDGKGGLLAGRAVTGTTPGSDVSLPSPCVAKPAPTMLMLVGPHSVALDIKPTCGDGAPTPRRFAFAAFAPAPSIRWSARVAEPPAGFSFTIDVEATDQDGDGVDDPTFLLGLEGGGMPWENGDRVSAKLPYWDRPAGLARDRKFPEASLQQVAQRASIFAGKKADAQKALILARRLRILHAALCTEGGSPWLDVGGERGVGCGPSKALEDGGLVEVRASLTAGDVLIAMATRERLAAAAVARTKKTRDDIDKLLEAAVTPVRWGSAKEIKSLPSTPSKGAPAWGALAFEATGKLLVRSTTEVVRADTTTFSEVISDDPMWQWEVKVPDKDARLSQVTDLCDAPSLSARFVGHDVPTGATLVPISLLPTFAPNRCVSGGANSPAVPVAWTDAGLFTLVAHELVMVPALTRTASPLAPATKVSGAFVQGAPRSPNGQWLVVPTRFGLYVRDETTSSASMVRVKDLEGLYLQLRECAVDNNGAKLACVRETKVVIVDATSAPSAE